MEVNENIVGYKPAENKKKKQQLNLTVAGGGLVLLGGGLAVAALVAVFNIIKNKNARKDVKSDEPKKTIPDDNKDHDVASRGLSFVLQTPPTTVNQNSCCTNQGKSDGVTVTQIDSGETISTHNVVLGDKPVPMMIADEIKKPRTSYKEILLSDGSCEEILLSDGSCEKAFTSTYEILGDEEFSSPAPDGVPLDEKENMTKNDSVDAIEVKKEDEAVDAQVLAGEENLSMPSLEEEDDDVIDIEEENVIEKEQESSEGKYVAEENSAVEEQISSDDPDKKSIALSDDIVCTGESSLAVMDGPSLDQPENMIVNESGEDLQVIETVKLIREEEAVCTDKLAVEENSPMRSVEDHQDSSFEEKVIENGSARKLTAEENLLMQSVKKEAEEETEEYSSEEHDLEKVEEGSLGKSAVEDNAVTQLVEEEDESEDDDNFDDISEEHVLQKVEEGSQGKLAVEDNSATQQVEEEDDDDVVSEDDEDNSNGDDRSEEEITEEEEESSEGTGSSSMESNVEAIWPAEMTDSPPQEAKETNVDSQNSGDKIVDGDGITEARNHDSVDCKSDGKDFSYDSDRNNEKPRLVLNKEAAQEMVTVRYQTVYSLKGPIWIWPILVLLLLLLMLYIHRTATPHDLPYHDSVIVP